MISALGSGLDRVARRWMPDPFLLAVLLTFVVAVVAVFAGNAFPADAGWLSRLGTTIGAWKQFVFEPPGSGADPVNRKLLYFAFQMCLMLVTGHALASSPPVARVVRRLASLPRDARGGVLLVAFVACAMALVHWGLGLIVGAMIAREVGRQAAVRGIPHHYPLLGAAGYTGLMIWGGGLSGSIPLAAAGQAGIPLSATLFSGLNLVISGALLLAIPLLCVLLVPKDRTTWVPFTADAGSDTTDDEEDGAPGQSTSRALHVAGLGLGALAAAILSDAFVEATIGWGARRWIYGALNALVVVVVVHRGVVLLVRFAMARRGDATPAERLEMSELVTVLLCTMALGWLEAEIVRGSFKLSFNNLNFAFLFLGLLFQGNPIRYVRAVGDGAAGCAGIILQFPLYFGILGIMVVTGLGGLISAKLAAVASESFYPVVTYFSAGLVNFFVPSGGGQWVVQGKIVIEGAAAFPSVIPKAIMALTYGDAWTNMLQPFWAVPLLAITGLRARDIIGYTATVMILGGALTVALLLVL